MTSVGSKEKRTVQSLGSLLSAPVIVLESAGVSQVCLVMAAKRVDAVLLVDASGSLSGILTGGDVSRRVVAAGLDGARTKCAAVMTAAPLSVRSSAAVSLALRQMVARRCRHLPVLSDDDGCDDDLAGLLDITQCVFARITALDQKDLARMDAVTVGHAVANSMLPLVGGSASIRDACIVMRDARHTGVLVVNEEDPNVLVGILTNKDVMLRVLAAGMDPEAMTVEEAMTPRPDFVTPSTPVLEALRMLNGKLNGAPNSIYVCLQERSTTDGHYLHLPVMQDNKPVGLVDLLTLTMSILDYMLKIDREQFPETHTDSQFTEGPLWNRFWNSSASHDDNSSYKADLTTSHEAIQNSQQRANNNNTNQYQTPPLPSPPHDMDNNIEPLDNDDANSITSAGAFYRKQKQKQQMIEAGISLTQQGRQQSMTPSILSTEHQSRTGTGNPDSFVFKVHDMNGTIHRFTAPATDFRLFVKAIEYKTGRNSVRVVYKNPQGLKQPLQTGVDLQVAVSEAKNAGMHRVVVYVVEEGVVVPRSNSKTVTPLDMMRASFDNLGVYGSGLGGGVGGPGGLGGVGSEAMVEVGWVRINVGGIRFETKLATLVAGSTYFAGVLGVSSGASTTGTAILNATGGAGGEVKVDRDGDLFKHVLHFLRMGTLSSSCDRLGLLKDLATEAEFYGVPELLKALQEKIKEAEQVVVVTSRDEMLEKLGRGFKVLLVEDGTYIMKKEG
ncbi:UNVERIFIED_CONTAM: hypothetical protein HDU68_000157 [Siphonaria sp. JEL0065]|nr:hypothetical protein HDU68_000157 [Siphonaria sp. JEL0065]